MKKLIKNNSYDNEKRRLKLERQTSKFFTETILATLMEESGYSGKVEIVASMVPDENKVTAPQYSFNLKFAEKTEEFLFLHARRLKLQALFNNAKVSGMLSSI
jgi:hypothetical protein